LFFQKKSSRFFPKKTGPDGISGKSGIRSAPLLEIIMVDENQKFPVPPRKTGCRRRKPDTKKAKMPEELFKHPRLISKILNQSK
jgi:hypothetical protein